MYKIPNDETVLEALKKSMDHYGTVDSQTKLKRLVEKEMAVIDPRYKVSGQRLRLLALGTDYIALEIYGRETALKKAISKCPVCGSRLKILKNQTIFGGTVTLGFLCKRCSYWTGLKRRVPIRYVFNLKHLSKK